MTIGFRACAEPALWEVDSDPSGFWWVEPNDADRNVIAFARASRDRERCLCSSPTSHPCPDAAAPRGDLVSARWRLIRAPRECTRTTSD